MEGSGEAVTTWGAQWSGYADMTATAAIEDDEAARGLSKVLAAQSE